MLRRVAADADDWITVDTLADDDRGRASSASPTAGPSWSSWSTAPAAGSAGSSARRSPRSRSRTGRPGGRRTIAGRGLALIGLLIGDPEPDVQKALSWALRSLAAVDPAGRDRVLSTRGRACRRDGRWRPRVGGARRPPQARPGRRGRDPRASSRASAGSPAPPTPPRPPRPPPPSCRRAARRPAPRTP